MSVYADTLQARGVLRAGRGGATRAALWGLAVAALACAAGAVVAVQPLIALAPLLGLALVIFAFAAPVTHLSLLLVITAVIGYTLQHRLGSHLLPSDALLLTGLLRASDTLMRKRLEFRRLLAVGLMFAFMVATLLQVIHGLSAGHNGSQTGDEARTLLGFGALLLAVPILDDARGRQRMGQGLVVVGLLLGLYGLVVWALGISFGENVDVGLRATAGFAASGSGQLHGGLYGYPVAVVMATAVLLAGRAGRGYRRGAVIAVLVLNLFCLMLTYERTFWLTTIVALAFVAVKMGRGRRLRAVVTLVITGLLTLGVLAAAFPADLTKIEARALTLGQATSDNSVRYRVVETQHVMRKVRAQPLAGSGLGDTMYWGQPWEQVRPRATWFAHNGYLWIIWKLGVLQAALLFGLLAWAVVSPARPERDRDARALRVAAQGGLLVLCLSSLTFPSFNSDTITATMGVLLAMCFIRYERPETSSARLDSASQCE
ncbi:MAG: O-Antigen ligase [Solirubrobacteraceae bacterium]|nr:O-Antigen ligase [Solirubrobacteraceae bacterium]